MKKYFVLLLFCLTTHLGLAQSYFQYDQAGNRVKRTGVPDLTLILQARPTTVHGTSTITALISVYELNGVATSGPITIKITKDARISLSFNPAATSVNGQPVQNSAWSFSGPSGGFYTLTTNQVIAAVGVLSVGLSGTLTPGSTDGQITISSFLLGGSGGEVRTDNNTSNSRIDYFAN